MLNDGRMFHFVVNVCLSRHTQVSPSKKSNFDTKRESLRNTLLFLFLYRSARENCVYGVVLAKLH